MELLTYYPFNMAAQITKSADDKVHTATDANSKYRIEIDRDVCIGAASCIALAGKTFALDGTNKLVFLEGDWDSDELLLAAAQSCPVFAIKIFDNATGQQLFPEA
jgi:ferredoxin